MYVVHGCMVSHFERSEESHRCETASETRITFDGEILSGNLEPDKLKSLRKWLVKSQEELNVLLGKGNEKRTN